MIILAAGLCILLFSTLLQGTAYMQTDGNEQAVAFSKAGRGWNQVPIGQKSVHSHIQKMVANMGNGGKGGVVTASNAASASANTNDMPDAGNADSPGSANEERTMKHIWANMKRRGKTGNWSAKTNEKRARQARQKELAGANLDALASSGLADKLGHKRWFGRLAKRNGGDVKQLLNDLSPASDNAQSVASAGASLIGKTKSGMGKGIPKSGIAVEDKDGSDDEGAEDDNVDDQQLDDAEFDDDLEETPADDTFEEETR